LDPISIAYALCAGIPENAIVVDESLTSGRESMSYTLGARPHDMINNLGGSIGYSPPVATGAALACPDRRTICLVGDGSAMYTIQALWTQARESLPVTTVVFANNTYNILKAEYANMGAGEWPSAAALTMIDIDNPAIDWLAMGRAMGVPGVEVDTAEGLAKALVDANGEAGPRLIAVKLA
ncbi:MAG: thiamine pyrophosphate-dependent enzyme, partial [Cypionkella sp.]